MTYQVKINPVSINHQPQIAASLAQAADDVYSTLVDGLDRVYSRTISYATYCLEYYPKYDAYHDLKNVAVAFERTFELAEEVEEAIFTLARISNDVAYWYSKSYEDRTQNHVKEYETTLDRFNGARDKLRESIAALRAIKSDVVELAYL